MRVFLLLLILTCVCFFVQGLETSKEPGPFSKDKTSSPEALLDAKIKEATLQYQEAKAQQIQRSECSTTIFILKFQQFDSILTGSEIEVPKDVFFTSNKSARKFSELRMPLESSEKIVAQVVGVLRNRSPGMGAMCHIPTHGIAITNISTGEVLFKGTVSLHCSNIVFDRPAPVDPGIDSLSVELRREIEILAPYPVEEQQKYDHWTKHMDNEEYHEEK